MKRLTDQKKANLSVLSLAPARLFPGWKKELVDKTVGDSFKVSIEPEDAYGPVKEDLLQEIPRDRFPENEDINPGMSFQAEGPNGPFMIIVKSLNDNNTVTIDLNHPLAGQRLHFDLSVAEVREPNAEELAQLAAGAGGCGCGCEPETKGECGSNASSGCGCAG